MDSSPPVQDVMERKVQESLVGTPYACSTLTKLSGGVANYVYRGTLLVPLADGSETVVVKHTEAFSASNNNFKITDTRCDYEQMMLEAVKELEALKYEGVEVKTPHLHYFSKDTNTQVYGDLPASLDLKTYVLKHGQALTQPQCTKLGHALGQWLHSFHVWGQAEEQEALVEKIKGNSELKELKWRINYEMLVGTVANFEEILGGDKEVFGKVRDRTKVEMEGDEGQLIHGDFWSGNIIFPSTLPDAKVGSQTPLQVLVLDWEMAQISSPAYDLGQMLAELFCLYHFKGIPAGKWLIESFIEGYQSAGRKVSKELACKTAIHAGTHLICWGSRVPGWGTKEQIEAVVRVGREWVFWGWEGSVEGSVEGFEGGVLRGMF